MSVGVNPSSLQGSKDRIAGDFLGRHNSFIWLKDSLVKRDLFMHFGIFGRQMFPKSEGCLCSSPLDFQQHARQLNQSYQTRTIINTCFQPQPEEDILFYDGCFPSSAIDDTYTVVNVVVTATMEQALNLHFLRALIIQVKRKKLEHHSLTDFSE